MRRSNTFILLVAAMLVFLLALGAGSALGAASFSDVPSTHIEVAGQNWTAR